MEPGIYEKGMRVREELSGPSHVEETINETNPHKRDLDNLVTHCLGLVWARTGLERKTRSLITIAMIAAQSGLTLKDYYPLKIHIKVALNNGCSKEEIYEVLLHAALYCGLLQSQICHRIAKETFDELERKN